MELERILNKRSKVRLITRDTRELNIAYNKVKDRFHTLEKMDKTVEDYYMSLPSAAKEGEEVPSDDYTTVYEYRDRFTEITVLYQSVLQSEPVPAQSTKANLPPLKLNKFDGNPKAWLNFWGNFKKIHEDERLPEEEKLLYLRQSMEEGSKAKRLVDTFPITKTSYKEAIDALTKRFGQNKYLIELYVRELLALVLLQAND